MINIKQFIHIFTQKGISKGVYKRLSVNLSPIINWPHACTPVPVVDNIIAIYSKSVKYII